MSPIRVFVGYDPIESLAYSVFAHSVLRRASAPVSVQPIMLSQFKGFYDRPRDPLQSTDFSFARFLVPHLCGYRGWAAFFDGDMICLDDVANLWALRDERFAVMVVKRDSHGTTSDGKKFLGRTQTDYPRKNWSSVMLINCPRWTLITPKYVSEAPGLNLHRFLWMRDALIGGLPSEWNHLVGVDAPRAGAKLVHYTLGMPFFNGHRECEYATEWRAERDAMMAFQGWRVGGSAK